MPGRSVKSLRKLLIPSKNKSTAGRLNFKHIAGCFPEQFFRILRRLEQRDQCGNFLHCTDAHLDTREKKNKKDRRSDDGNYAEALSEIL